MRRIGIFGGSVVEDNDTEQQRFRVKVRVNGVDSDNAPLAGLPWAEVLTQGAAAGIGGVGDFRPYRIGDKVFVMFINGNASLPVVVGSMITTRGGIPSIPLAALTDYEGGLQRWTRSDRETNTVELSEKSNEKHVVIRSGAASIRVSKLGDVIHVKSMHGKIRVEGASVEVLAGNAAVRASNVTIDAGGDNELLMPAGTATVKSNDTVDIITDNPTSPGGIPTPLSTDEINIGGRIDRLKGVAVPPPLGKAPTQTARNNFRAQTINIGVGAGTNPTIDTAGFPPIPLPPTLNINIRSALGVAIKTSGFCSIDSTGPTSITASLVTISSLTQLTVQAHAMVNILASGPVNIGSASTLTITAATLSFLTVPATPPIFSPPVP